MKRLYFKCVLLYFDYRTLKIKARILLHAVRTCYHVYGWSMRLQDVLKHYALTWWIITGQPDWRSAQRVEDEWQHLKRFLS